VNNEDKILALLEKMQAENNARFDRIERGQANLERGQANLETEVRDMHNYIVAKIENKIEPDVRTLLDGQAAIQDELTDIRTRLAKLPGIERDVSALKSRAAM
jgi:uncharacterized protein involved in exopolysaccharide biosynthesis